ncbi:MAG: hypothetical protein KDA96_07170, partial [Planctomycetaceae bacterium]|nr:hypothetical protein [Planctomycetaceae bacterium]
EAGQFAKPGSSRSRAVREAGQFAKPASSRSRARPGDTCGEGRQVNRSDPESVWRSKRRRATVVRELVAAVSCLFVVGTYGAWRFPEPVDGSRILPAPPPLSETSHSVPPGTSGDNIETVPRNLTFTIRDVPAGAILVLGSWNQSGGRHRFEITTQRDPAQRDSSNVIRVSCNSGDNHRPSRAPGRLLSQPTQPPNEGRLLKQGRSGSQIPVRRFQVPLSSGGIQSRPVLARRIAGGQRVVVYQDECLPGCDEAAMERLCHRMESGIVAFVEQYVGELRDLDGDGQLTLVIAELTARHQLVASTLQDGEQVQDRDQVDLAASPPILACVRPADWLHPESDGFGDSIYVDPDLLDAFTPAFAEGTTDLGDPGQSDEFFRDLDGILIHELTHAAVFSRLLGREAADIPEWLHEALAHLVELQSVGADQNLSGRIEFFHSAPECCPVMTHPLQMSFEERRGGCRVAGAFFLQSILRNNDDGESGAPVQLLNALLDCRGPVGNRLQSLCDVPLEEVFRQWTLDMALARRGKEPRIPLASDSGDQSIVILGTASCSLMAHERIPQLTVRVSADAVPQVSLLE